MTDIASRTPEVAGTNAGQTSITTDVPAGTQAGDLLLWAVSGNSGSLSAPTTPTGWSVLFSWTVVGTSVLLGLVVYYRVAPSSPPGSYTLSGLSSGRWSAVMRSEVDANVATVPDVATGSNSSTSGQATTASVTPETNRAKVIAFEAANAASGVTNTTWSTSGAATVDAQASSTAGGAVNTALGSASIQTNTPASTGPVLTPSGTISRGINVTVALRIARQEAELGTATETTTLDPLTFAKAIELSTPGEADGAYPITPAKQLDLGTATESATPQPLSASKVATLAATADAGTVHPITPGKVRELGTATEAAAGQALSVSKVVELGTATEVDDTAGALAASKVFVLGTATESGEAHPLAFDGPDELTVILGTATESDTVHALTISKRIELGTATESTTVHPFEAAKLLELGLSVEASAAAALLLRKVVDLGLVTEIGEAHPFSYSRPRRPGVMIVSDRGAVATVDAAPEPIAEVDP